MGKALANVKAFEGQIDIHWSDIKNQLPSTVDPDKFRSAAVTAVRREKGLLDCTVESLIDSCTKCASDGLIPDGREAVILPFYDRDKKAKIATYMPMVQGIIKRAKELGEVFSISSRVVFENDTIKFQITEDEDTLLHEPALKDRGDMIGAYAIFRDKDRNALHIEYMPGQEIDQVRSFSKAKDGPAWKNWATEMWRKTVIRRGAKYVPMCEALRTIVSREDEYIDLNAKPENIPANPLDDGAEGPVLDGEYTEESGDFGPAENEDELEEFISTLDEAMREATDLEELKEVVNQNNEKVCELGDECVQRAQELNIEHKNRLSQKKGKAA